MFAEFMQIKEMKETADRTLAKVRREIREATKMLDTMKSLQKLRDIRKDTAEKRGIYFFNVFFIY